ncbi:MAG: methyltransferase [Sphingobium sp.]
MNQFDFDSLLFPQCGPEDTAGTRNSALLQLVKYLAATGYDFVTPTPATHGRVVKRARAACAVTIRDVLGWSMPFLAGTIDPEVERLLQAADMLEQTGQGLRSTLRVSALHGHLFLHSAFPTEDDDAVFLGPDSYRFADLIERELIAQPSRSAARIVDLGTGTGVGAIVAGELCRDAELWGTDINPEALKIADVNARAAGLPIGFQEGRDFAGLDGQFDLVLANPPYIIDAGKRAYRDGGGMHGGEVALDMARAALPRLNPRGRLILYTGSAIVQGMDNLQVALKATARQYGCELSYREIDPDVFGEELERPGYEDVDRIAVISAVFSLPSDV